MRSLCRLLTSIALLALLATVSTGFAQGEAPSGGTLNLAFAGSTGGNTDPNRNNTIGYLSVSRMMTDVLVEWHEGEFHGELAESWQFSDDGLSITFRLNGDATFHDGSPVTSEDVRATFERITREDDPLPQSSLIASVTSFDVHDDHSFTVGLSNVNPDFVMGLGRIFIVSAATVDNPTPIGTGPFRVAEHVPDQRMLLERVDDYWQGTPNLERVTVRDIPDLDTIVLELEAGTVDMINFVPVREVRRLEGLGFQALPFVRVNTARLAINLSTVDDAQLRQAICYALDREVVLDNAYAGFGIPQYTLAVQDTWAFNDDVTPYEYDPERSREILAELGYTTTNRDGVVERDGEPLILNFPSRGDGEWLLATQIMQQMLADVGIGTRITTADSATYYSNVRTGNYDLAWWLSNAPPEPPIIATNLHSETFWNVTQRDDPELDALIDRGRYTVDQDIRAEAYRELQRVHLEEAMECLMFWVQQVHVASPDFGGLYVMPDGIMTRSHTWYREQ